MFVIFDEITYVYIDITQKADDIESLNYSIINRTIKSLFSTVIQKDYICEKADDTGLRNYAYY